MPTHVYRRPEIIDRVPLGGHCVIEASAGTGKTFAIEHLVIEILLRQDIRLDQILCVTFTEKAAAELRARIRKTLERGARGELSEEDIGPVVALDGAQVARLEAALFSFERAPIDTIHGFCRRTLLELAFQSGTRPSLEVVDARTIFHEAFRAELREHFASDEWMGRLLKEWLAEENRDADRLETLLFKAHSRRYLDTRGPELNVETFKELLVGFKPEQLARELARIKKAPLTAFREIAEAVGRSNRDPELLRSELQSAPLDKLAGLADAPGFSDESRRSLRLLQRARLSANLEARVVDAFLEPVAMRLDRIKRERGVVDFADMPGWLWDALEGPQGSTLVGILRERFRFGLIDEFQDTDDLQWRIFRRIFVESGGTNRLIVIADPKQAIYAFRDADVFTYLTARQALTKEHKAAFVPLTQNFRSTADMIDAINLIFAPEPSSGFFAAGDIRYDHPVTCGRPEIRANYAGEAVKPITIFSLSRDAKLTARRYRGMVGRKMAATLKELLAVDGGIDIAERTVRRVKAGGVFVLTRTLMESREIAGYLREAGVPYAFYKQDGLFETREAGHVLDVLRAVAEPQRRSNRYKAWSTPFFGVELRDLPGLDDVPSSHPLMARLLEWKTLAEQERFANLFNAMLHGSGLAARELLLADSARELTNYEHIFEILLERTLVEKPSFLQLIEMLASWVDGSDLPPGENPGVQRIESDRDAVQIMTVHKAKGLEADVVVLFGGYARGWQRDEVSVFHVNGAREVVVGAGGAVKKFIDAEEHSEDERLLYVALTRSRAKLYLAAFPEGSTRVKLSGYYKYLNERLAALITSDGANGRRFAELIETVTLSSELHSTSPEDAAIVGAIRAWTPPDSIIDERGDSDYARACATIVSRRPGLSVSSYTSLQRRLESSEDLEAAAFKYDVDSLVEGPVRQDLAGGRSVGIFLHEVIERIDLDILKAAPDLETWERDAGVRVLIAESARRHRIPDREAWIKRGADIVFNALRAPIALDGVTVAGLANCPGRREMEFMLPIPAEKHPLLGADQEGKWKIERGVLIGFVDFVFSFGNRTYFADWKSDQLRSYDSGAVAARVVENYRIQEQIYTVGIVRLLRIRSRREYEERFGGLLYIFLRGIDLHGDGRTGVYFHRPSWDEVVAYERSFIESRELHA